MIFLANRTNLDKRTLLTRIHTQLQSQAAGDDAPIKQVRYHTSSGNKVGVRALLDAQAFLGFTYPGGEVELHASFDFPPNRDYDFYEIQWVEPDRKLMLGWHQDDTHMDLGNCHFQIDYQSETVQRTSADFLDAHPLNVFERRLDQFIPILDVITWEDELPTVPNHAIGGD
ncbi:hypothetical protein PNQ29_03305 [Halobacterium salinarum]|uniref:hypothetical protein n=1 Tax=Halobacterium salinarum TaxID=2242 RepID=UPI002556694B|nr:hypothetical protein [Halobacterium salinarum]MDL0118504.1 hypothetical protein [Halobacterium salinarum]MDL0118717.1 hypothetical protein [Halobacterium salinarum]MDL0118771.1 hypothetical protein [Halobacterium salinarum]